MSKIKLYLIQADLYLAPVQTRNQARNYIISELRNESQYENERVKSEKVSEEQITNEAISEIKSRSEEIVRQNDHIEDSSIEELFVKGNALDLVF